ncbi:hypothetical protein AGABI1DRAFT_125579 [Agaricus bisporus var. burnettii JB137-S8]|uniref:Defective in cullin neddylation protein n=1 Tax=Agaricus bisporus var. burnettii (strain JB137-S8 / ATCC MYA-4627 / FGSC 10392) TaxID=597362 RepID=K5Y4Y4_AGABU|nr:uncharacterized protein AGABI1DRAFT_125579 [Agaricus bisporus var. burnettii JB137-S8]EKM83100.1 hypothetical protein AGABI1DRAFT_125579 [Agaricus bisporus var. burnettii JB137-S8]
MPPKRKLAESTQNETTRSTRSSTRNRNTDAKDTAAENVVTKHTTKRGTKSSTSQAPGEGHVNTNELPPPAKKPRTSKGPGRGKKESKIVEKRTAGRHLSSEAHLSHIHSAPTAREHPHTSFLLRCTIGDEDLKAKQSKSSSITAVEAIATNSKLASKPVEKPPNEEELYTPERALALFSVYADPDEPDVIGPDGFEKLCQDAGLSMDGPVPLLLAWQVEAKEMAKISKEEWTKGSIALRVSSPQTLSTALTDLSDLLIRDKPPVKKSKTDSYDRTRYWTYASDPKSAFHKFYTYCFVLVKPPSSKNIEMETATAFWSVLLGSKYPLMNEVLGFIEVKGTYRAANKDLWNMMLEFCETINPNLDNFEADGAWPTLLDEFASWKSAK